MAIVGAGEAWRALCEERILLDGGSLAVDPRLRARQVRDRVALEEWATFDPELCALLDPFARAASDLAQGGGTEAARAMLTAARAYHRALGRHPAMTTDPETAARDMVRTTVDAYVPLLGPDVVARIRVDVLGDVRTDEVQCRQCGAVVDDRADALVGCRHCGAVQDVSSEDAWTPSRLALFEIVLGNLVRTGDLDGPTPAIAALGTFIHTDVTGVTVPMAFGFLRRAIPWLPAADVALGLELTASAVTEPGKVALLEGLDAALESWVADPSERPTPAPLFLRTPEAFPAPTEDEEAAWVAYACSMPRPDDLLELLAMPLSTVQSAAVEQLPTGVSARAALAYFEAMAPGFDRAAMREEIRPLQPGYDHPRVAAFLSELVDLLGD